MDIVPPMIIYIYIYGRYIYYSKTLEYKSCENQKLKFSKSIIASIFNSINCIIDRKSFYYKKKIRNLFFLFKLSRFSNHIYL